MTNGITQLSTVFLKHEITRNKLEACNFKPFLGVKFTKQSYASLEIFCYGQIIQYYFIHLLEAFELICLYFLNENIVGNSQTYPDK